MIVWSGFGFLTAVLALLGLLIGNSLPGSIPYHASIGILLGAVVNWFVGKKLNNTPGRILVDEETGERLQYKRKHTFFWIAMEWWSIILVVLAVLFAFSDTAGE